MPSKKKKKIPVDDKGKKKNAVNDKG